MRLPRPLTLLLVALAAACGNGRPPASESTQPPLVLQIVSSSDNQAGVEGLPLPAPLVVQVTRARLPVRGVAIQWTAEEGEVRPVSLLTNTGGYASAEWILPDGPGPKSVRARVQSQPELEVRFTAVVLERLLVTALATDSAIGPDSSVTLRLEVRGARDGLPRGSIPVGWELPAPHGPTTTLTDAAGVATVVWPTGRVAGRQVATAQVQGSLGPKPFFPVTVRPGAPVAIEATIPLPSLPPDPRWSIEVALRSVDAFGNRVARQRISLQEPAGLLRVVMLDSLTDSLGNGRARVIPTGRFGMATLLASLNEGAAAPVGTVALHAEIDLVQLYHVGPPPYGFRSYRNGSMPAIDTIPVGMTGRWVLEPFDYEMHDVTILADSGFVGGGILPYANPSFVQVTFTLPGTYQYRDMETGANGTVVVLP